MAITHINGEPVEPVRTWESLRHLDILWLVGCSFCGRNHRVTLISYDRAGDGWKALPPLGCQPGEHLILRCGTRGDGPAKDPSAYRVINPPVEEPAEERSREHAR